jgi:hypothetical protein
LTGFPWLRFTSEAQIEFELWREKLEARIRGGELPLALESHLGKYRGLIPRLALITHLIDVGSGPIGLEAVLKALALSEYLEAHAARLYAAGAEPERAAAKVILAKIRGGDLKDRFTGTCTCTTGRGRQTRITPSSVLTCSVTTTGYTPSTLIRAADLGLSTWLTRGVRRSDLPGPAARLKSENTRRRASSKSIKSPFCYF